MVSVDLNKVPHAKIITTSLLIFATLVAPFWFFFQFDYTTFTKLPTSTVLLVSLSYGFPVLLLNFSLFWAMLVITGRHKKPEQWINYLALASVLTIIVFYAPGLNIRPRFFGQKKVGLREAIHVSMICQLAVTVFVGILQLRSNTLKNADNEIQPENEQQRPSPEIEDTSHLNQSLPTEITK